MVGAQQPEDKRSNQGNFSRRVAVSQDRRPAAESSRKGEDERCPKSIRSTAGMP